MSAWFEYIYTLIYILLISFYYYNSIIIRYALLLKCSILSINNGAIYTGLKFITYVYMKLSVPDNLVLFLYHSGIYIYIYIWKQYVPYIWKCNIYGIYQWRIFINSYRKLPRAGFEPTTAQFCSDAPPYWAIRS